jgi:hypothetical protein
VDIAECLLRSLFKDYKMTEVVEEHFEPDSDYVGSQDALAGSLVMAVMDAVCPLAP